MPPQYCFFSRWARWARWAGMELGSGMEILRWYMDRYMGVMIWSSVFCIPEQIRGPPLWEHALLTPPFSKLREPILKCPGALKSSEVEFSDFIFLGFFPRQISCQRELWSKKLAICYAVWASGRVMRSLPMFIKFIGCVIYSLGFILVLKLSKSNYGARRYDFSKIYMY